MFEFFFYSVCAALNLLTLWFIYQTRKLCKKMKRHREEYAEIVRNINRVNWNRTQGEEYNEIIRNIKANRNLTQKCHDWLKEGF